MVMEKRGCQRSKWVVGESSGWFLTRCMQPGVVRTMGTLCLRRAGAGPAAPPGPSRAVYSGSERWGGGSWVAVTEIGEKGWENAAVRGPSGSLGVLWVVFDEVHVARRGAHHGHTVPSARRSRASCAAGP